MFPFVTSSEESVGETAALLLEIAAPAPLQVRSGHTSDDGPVVSVFPIPPSARVNVS
jgi:hypothetical protein